MSGADEGAGPSRRGQSRGKPRAPESP